VFPFLAGAPAGEICRKACFAPIRPEENTGMSNVRMPLIRELRQELRRRADPEKARSMQAYMKSTLPYYGVQTPGQKEVHRLVLPRHPLRDFAEWQDTVLALWRDARFREERYATIALTGYKSYVAFQVLDALPLYEELVVTGAWWDYVDTIASGRIGPLLRLYPKPMRPILRRWSGCDDLWKRRASILCQLSFKKDTDLKLLYACIEPSLENPEFFLRKGIGWALRQHAWTDPEEIRRYVQACGSRMSPLTRREALKNVGPGPDREP
jgi:3-methyladenine DNA glycosylase AlkD